MAQGTGSSQNAIEATATVVPGSRLEYKRVDKIYVISSGEWVVNEASDIFPGAASKQADGPYKPYVEYVFLVRRKIKQTSMSPLPQITTKILVQSEQLIQVMEDVFQDIKGLGWHFRPFKVDPQLLRVFSPVFKNLLVDLQRAVVPDETTVQHLSFLVNFIDTEYAPILRDIANLQEHAEITFDLIWALFLPRSIVFTSCPTTSEPHAVRLRRLPRRVISSQGKPYWMLKCDYISGSNGFPSPGHAYGLATMILQIPYFDGVKKISDLAVFPIGWHPDADEIRQTLVERGRRWVALNGIQHLHYDGIAYSSRSTMFGSDRDVPMHINQRVMLDSDAYHNHSERNGNLRTLSGAKVHWGDDISALTKAEDLTEDDLLLASPVLYGFGLNNKLWLKFNVGHLQPVGWNDQVLKNTVIDSDRKLLIQSLVDSHVKNNKRFDDFVQGKGLGLVINLFGPPGVGKTLTVEGITEHLRKPLYVVGAGELGTDPSTLENKLQTIFELAPTWDAIVLIDEADVFLAERTISELQRNAMVAVFLRSIEYFQGILFLTTNRVKTFDQAFQSRIHLSLHYENLSTTSREHVWRAFLEKARNTISTQDPSMDEYRQLSEMDLNGRQIKNIVKLAVILASSEKSKLTYYHLVRTMKSTGHWQ